MQMSLRNTLIWLCYFKVNLITIYELALELCMHASQLMNISQTTSAVQLLIHLKIEKHISNSVYQMNYWFY